VRCTLIYNPAAGPNRAQRSEQIRRVASALTAQGHQIEAVSTTAPGSAIQQTSNAASCAEIVFACGGDGTVHEVLQSLVSETASPQTALGIIPLGSANALARHLQLPLEPLAAAIAQINGKPQTISVGKLVSANQHRYFTVMAGAGPDGALARKVLASHKSTLGRLAHYLQAAKLFLTHPFPTFEVEYREVASNHLQSRPAVSVMTVRVGDLGGLFGRLAPRQASIHDQHLSLLILAPPAILSLPLWFLSGWPNLHRLNPFLTFANATSLHCQPLASRETHFQADGEWLGQLPISVSILPNALRILTPNRHS